MKETQTKQKTQMPKPGDRLTFNIPYFLIPHEVFDKTKTVYQAIVLIYLMRCAQLKDGLIYPSYLTIARNCHISVASVHRAVEDLCQLGAINITYRLGDTNLFEITLEGVSVRQTPPVTVTDPPLSQRHTSNKEFKNKELLIEPIIFNPSTKPPPPKTPEVIARLARDPHYRFNRDIDQSAELIPLNKAGKKLPGSMQDVLGKIRSDIEKNRRARGSKAV